MSGPARPVAGDTWQALRRFTDARIALGRAGVSLPTVPHLAFQRAHAEARDAVHLPLDGDAVARALTDRGHEVLRLHSAATDRAVYLRRPDWGRRLDDRSRRALRDRFGDPEAGQGATYDVAFVIADGLSARAVHHHAVALLDAVTAALPAHAWRVAPVALVEQGRVAIGDEIAAALGAAMVAVLIGERPGLSSPDSLGVYFTFEPGPGCTDAQRNCLSNIRQAGLGYAEAAHTLLYLMTEARRRGYSGVALKDEAGAAPSALEPASTPPGTSFLTG